MNLDQITIAPVFPLWLILLLFFLGLVSAIVQYRLHAGKTGAFAGPWAFLSSAWVRSPFSSLLLSIPLWLRRKSIRYCRPLRSFWIPLRAWVNPDGQEKASRLEEAKALLTEGATPLLNSLSERFEVRLYGVGESLKAIEAKGAGRFEGRGQQGKSE